jgi:two-component system, chemotaxis family, protein-glutamate methylesterase/glutaminase
MVAVHMRAGGPSRLAQILDRSGPLPAVAAIDGALLEVGRIYVAVPGNHLLARDHRVVLSDGPWESGRRPAIDALFRSVAIDYGPHAIAVLMSGLLDDGVAGLQAVRAKGGVTVVQEPTDALFPDLPGIALAAGVADYMVAAKDIGGLLVQLADRDVEEQVMDPDGRLELENQIAMGGRFAISVDAEELGPPTGYACSRRCRQGTG